MSTIASRVPSAATKLKLKSSDAPLSKVKQRTLKQRHSDVGCVKSLAASFEAAAEVASAEREQRHELAAEAMDAEELEPELIPDVVDARALQSGAAAPAQVELPPWMGYSARSMSDSRIRWSA